jgi:MFS family permease
MLMTVVPVLQADIAPPASRGMLVALNGVLIIVAYTLAAWIGVACYFSINPKFQWRFPLELQVLWPVLILMVISWIPESPRWRESFRRCHFRVGASILLLVLERKRRDEAWKIIARLHQRSDDSSDSFAQKEFYQMCRQIEVDEALAAGESWLALFQKPSYRKRVICAFFMMYAGQASGNLVIASISPQSHSQTANANQS